MKIHHFRQPWLFTVTLLPVLMLSCSDDFPDKAADDSTQLPIEFSALIEQDNSSRADESGFADGDRMGVFVVNYSNNAPGSLSLSANQVNNVSVSFNKDQGKWTPSTDIYWLDDSTPADVYGYYPFSNALSDVNAHSFEVAYDQSLPAADGDMASYEASDFLWAKAERVTPGKRVDLAYRHILAGVKVVLEKGEGFTDDEWAKLPRTVSVDNTLRHADIDLSTGSVSATGSLDRNIVMNPEAECYRAVVIPQSLAAGKSLIGITIDGISSSFLRDGGMTYTPGKLHTFTLRIDRKDPSGNFTVSLVSEEISPWIADTTSHDFTSNSYLVVHVAKEGTLKQCLADIHADAATLKNLKITGRITEEDFTFMREEMSSLSSLNLKEVKTVHISYPLTEIYTNSYGDRQYDYSDDMLPDEVFLGMMQLKRIILPDNITRIGESSFQGLSLNSTVIIPESVKRIGKDAFREIKSGYIKMSGSIEHIGACAFQYTTADLELNLSNTIKKIGFAAFDFATGATGKFNVPNKLEYLGEWAFRSCGHDLTGDITIPSTLKSIPGDAFGSMGFNNGTNLTIEEGVVKIEESAFEDLKFHNHVNIPHSVIIIGPKAFIGCHFSGGLSIHDNIIDIAAGAFAWSNISGDFIYPTKSFNIANAAFTETRIKSLTLSENILQISDQAFYLCRELEKVYISKNIERIGSQAFSGCEKLSLIVCLAKEPPVMPADVFDGCYLDKMILEVPEESVDAYKMATGWNSIKSITPHHELAFNIPEIRCLDKGVIRSGVIRSEGAWRMESCPSWVHVTPESAPHKENVTISVDMGSVDRKGEIVFSLVDKNYKVTVPVHQFTLSDAKEDTEILLQRATASGDAIPVFIVGEGFGADRIISGEYMERMRSTMEHLFAIEPYKTYRDRFTVATAIACSPEDGTSNLYTIKETRFHADATQPYDKEELKQYVREVSPSTAEAMNRALIIMVSNYGGFAGWSEIDYDGCSLAGVATPDDVYPYDMRGLVQHYAGGAAFAGLAQEHVTHFEHIKGCSCPCCHDFDTYYDMKSRGYYANITISGRMSDSPWYEFIFHPRYSQMVDMWEGGYRHLRGVWRSEAQSAMGTYIPYYNTISRYTIYKEIMRRSGQQSSFDDFVANDKIEIPQ